MAAERLIEHLGGVEVLQKEAPHVLHFLQESVIQPPADNYYIGVSNDARLPNDGGLSDDAKSVFLGVEEVYADQHGIHTLMRADFDRKQQTIDIMAVLYNAADESEIIRQSKHFNNTSYAEFNIIVDNAAAMKSLHSPLRVEADYTWSDDGETSTTKRIVFLVDEYEEGKPIISGIEVEKPRAKDGKRTQVLYDRESFFSEKIDYHYEHVLLNNGKSAKTMMPFKGKITVSDGLEICGILTSVPLEKPKLYMLLEQGGSVEYNNGKSFVEQCVVSKDKKSLTWEIADDWNQVLNLERFHIETILDFSCSFTLQVVDPKEPSRKYMPRIMINSVDNPSPYAAGSGALEIEKINLKWGCMAGDTMIAMGDGACKEISSIKVGDVIKTVSGCAAVTNIYKGVEKELVYLETKGGHVLKMTKSHPVKTKRGYIRASELTAADTIVTVDGESGVKHLYMMEYGEEVYNLELEQSEAMICNDIMAGDFVMQNSYKPLKRNRLSVLQEEFARLYGGLDK